MILELAPGGFGGNGGAGGGDTGGGGGGNAGGGGGNGAGGGGDAGGGGGLVVPALTTFTITGTEIRRESPGAVSQMYTRPELAPGIMLAVSTFTLTTSCSVVMVLMLP